MTKSELGKKIYDISHLSGNFTLRSGQTSSEYFDKYRFEAQPSLLKAIAKELAPAVPIGTEVLAGLEVGGIPIATALSFETGLPCLFVRKEAKDYGTCKLAEGLEIEGKKVCIIEDVITTGGQVVASTGQLRDLGAIINDVLCVIYRSPEEKPTRIIEAQLNLNSLFTMDELKALASS